MPDKPLLFVDFDGTLCFDRFWRSTEPVVYDSIQQSLFIGNGTLVREWMQGKHTAEEINRYLSEKLSVPYKALWDTFVSDCTTMRIDMQLLEALESLRPRYTTVLVTGNMDSFSRFTRPALQLDDYFDAIENSYERGMLKDEDDGYVFKLYAELYGSRLEDAHLIDDSTNVCEVFAKTGGNAHLVQNPEDTLTYLKELAR